MRFYVDQLQMEAKPLKVYYFGSCFRYDRPQKGRYREFWQFGCELIGTDRPEATAELIALAHAVLKEAGLNRLILRVGNLDMLRAFLDGIGARDAEVMRLIDKQNYEALQACLAPDDFQAFENFIRTRRLDALDTPEAISLASVLSYLDVFNVPYTLDLSIARGLEYYVGTVFEIDAPRLGAEKQLCGGGSYNLVPLLGGRRVPTAGFAIGFDRTLLALESEGVRIPRAERPVYIVKMGDMGKEAVAVATALRAAGIRTDMDLMGRNLKKAFDHADRQGMRTVVLVAPDEWQRDAVVVKDMRTGEQHEVSLRELTAHLHALTP
jgi:histidyl-tRNA synthetase